jgi:hypothetical protein
LESLPGASKIDKSIKPNGYNQACCLLTSKSNKLRRELIKEIEAIEAVGKTRSKKFRVYQIIGIL